MRAAIKRQTLLVAVLALVLVRCQPTSQFSEVERRNQPSKVAGSDLNLPDGWRLDAISEGVPAPDHDKQRSAIGTNHVLAWKVLRDSRPLTVETCLVLKEFARPDGNRWVLAAVHRNSWDQWNVGYVLAMMQPEGNRPGYCREIRYCKTFETPPHNKDVYAFMDEFEWSLEAEDPWKLPEGGICTGVWRFAVGEEPTRFFNN